MDEQTIGKILFDDIAYLNKHGILSMCSEKNEYASFYENRIFQNSLSIQSPKKFFFLITQIPVLVTNKIDRLENLNLPEAKSEKCYIETISVNYADIDKLTLKTVIPVSRSKKHFVNFTGFFTCYHVPSSSLVGNYLYRLNASESSYINKQKTSLDFYCRIDMDMVMHFSDTQLKVPKYALSSMDATDGFDQFFFLESDVINVFENANINYQTIDPHWVFENGELTSTCFSETSLDKEDLISTSDDHKEPSNSINTYGNKLEDEKSSKQVLATGDLTSPSASDLTEAERVNQMLLDPDYKSRTRHSLLSMIGAFNRYLTANPKKTFSSNNAIFDRCKVDYKGVPGIGKTGLRQLTMDSIKIFQLAESFNGELGEKAFHQSIVAILWKELRNDKKPIFKSEPELILYLTAKSEDLAWVNKNKLESIFKEAEDYLQLIVEEQRLAKELRNSMNSKVAAPRPCLNKQR